MQIQLMSYNSMSYVL